MATPNINEYASWTEDTNSPVFDHSASRVLPLTGFLRPKFSILLGASGAAELLAQTLTLRDAAADAAGVNLLKFDYSLIVPGSVSYGAYAAAAARVVDYTATDLSTNGSNPSQSAALKTFRHSGRDIDSSSQRSYTAFGSTKALRIDDIVAQMANDPSWIATEQSSEVLRLTERVPGSFAQVQGLVGFTAVVQTEGSVEINSGKTAKALGVPGSAALADTDQLTSTIFTYRLPTTITSYGFQEQGTPGNTSFGFENVYVLVLATSAGATPGGALRTILQGQNSPVREYYAVTPVPTPVPVPVPTP